MNSIYCEKMNIAQFTTLNKGAKELSTLNDSSKQRKHFIIHICLSTLLLIIIVTVTSVAMVFSEIWYLAVIIGFALGVYLLSIFYLTQNYTKKQHSFQLAHDHESIHSDSNATLSSQNGRFSLRASLLPRRKTMQPTPNKNENRTSIPPPPERPPPTLAHCRMSEDQGRASFIHWVKIENFQLDLKPSQSYSTLHDEPVSSNQSLMESNATIIGNEKN